MNRILIFVLLGLTIFIHVACTAPTPESITQPPGVPTAFDLPEYAPPEQSEDASEAYPVDNETTSIENVVPPVDVPKPESGKAAVSGTVYSVSGSKPFADAIIYLTPAQGENKDLVPPVLVGQQPERGDVPGKTDDSGNFAINNIAPGNYYMVVFTGTYEVAKANAEAEKALMITLKENDQQKLGVLVVP